MRGTGEREARLLEELGRLTAAFDQSALPMLLLGRTGCIEYANAAFERLSGYSLRELWGTQRNLLHSEFFDESLSAEIWRRLADGVVWRGDLEFRRKDGGLYWDHSVFTPLRDAGGAVTRHLVVKTDITDRKRIDETLYRENGDIASFMDAVRAGYFRLDRNTRFVTVNQTWLQLHERRQASEVVGQPYALAYPDSDPGPALGAIERALEGGQSSPVALTFSYSDGRTGHLSCTFTALQMEGQVVGVEGLVVDATELHKSQEQTRRLYEEMNDGIVVFEAVQDDYRVVLHNKAFTGFVRRPVNSVDGLGIAELLPLVHEHWRDVFRQVEKEGRPASFEDGDWNPGNFYKIRVYQPVAGRFACLIEDRTLEHSLQVQLLESQKIEAVSRVAGGVAHDFNNVLTALIMRLDLLRESGGLSEAMQDLFVEIRKDADRAAGISRQLMHLGRRQSLNLQAVDLHAVVRDVSDMLGRLIGDDIAIGLMTQPGHWVNADPALISHVLTDLSMNAREAMAEGGRITLEVTRCEAAREGEAREPWQAVDCECIRVSDTGCGIRPEDLKRIFEPFFTTKPRGSGLGLSTALGVVEEHGGWMTVSSEVGMGSCFSVYLPSVGQPALSVMTEGSVPPFPRGTRILLVEDDANIRGVVMQCLVLRGACVLEAGDALSAMQAWSGSLEPVDLVLSDMILPGAMNGLALIGQIRTKRPGTKAILASGYNFDYKKEFAEGMSGVLFLRKPYTEVELLETVRRALGG